MNVPDTTTANADGADHVHHAEEGGAQQRLALFTRARDWMWQQNASSWVADAFGHWVIAEIAPHEPVPERLGDLWARWNYGAMPQRYRARHGARLSASPPWAPGQPLPGPLR